MKRERNKMLGERIEAIVALMACVLVMAGGAAAQGGGREVRLLTREEVLAAIDRTLSANGWKASEALSASDVQLAANVSVTEAAPRLQVTQIQASPDGATMRMLMWVASEPRVPPFWVRLNRVIDFGGNGQAVALEVRQTPERNDIVSLSERMVKPGGPARDEVGAVLVKAGAPVELVVRAGGMRIQSTGIPLERGRSGDEVRVRTLPSGKILVGTVVGEQIVQVSF